LSIFQERKTGNSGKDFLTQGMSSAEWTPGGGFTAQRSARAPKGVGSPVHDFGGNMKMIWKRFRSSRIFLLVLITACSVAASSVASAADPSLVTTDKGVVQGIVATNYRAFLGIPYAAPPVGNLRWKAPQSPAAWSTTLDATHFGSACPQIPSFFSAGPSINEDCLYLNVYTPNPVGTRKLPVMVWLHGGAFVVGAGSDYNPADLVVKGGVIVVTINYRLGPFGFLAHPALSAEASDHSSGNYGLMDQQFALNWVKRNISAFGGNASKVTIFGESAGGFSVCAHLASPTARGLFSRAITESGPCTEPLPTLATAEANGAAFGASLGCTTAACLRSLSVPQILAAAAAIPISISNILSFSPNVGGNILPNQLQTALLLGRYNHVPIIEGTNHDEGTLFVALAYDYQGHPLTAAEYPSAVQTLVGGSASIAQQVLAQYPLSHYSSPGAALADVVTDAGFSCPARAADQLLSFGVPTFAYEFNDPNVPNPFPPATFPFGVYHSSEIQYILEVLGQTPPFSADQQRLSDAMIGYWSQFADTGNPNFWGAPGWPYYNVFADDFLSLVPPSPKVKFNFSSDHKCLFWTGVALQQLFAM
jgi:para-nitrobenzyl esterase